MNLMHHVLLSSQYIHPSFHNPFIFETAKFLPEENIIEVILFWGSLAELHIAENQVELVELYKTLFFSRSDSLLFLKIDSLK